MLQYVKEVGPEELNGCEAFGLAKAAGKDREFFKAAGGLNQQFVHMSIDDVKAMIERNRDYLLHKIGLDHDGKPLKTKKYKVRYHIACTSEQEVEATNPDDAKEKANQLLWEDSDACALYIYRDDILSASVISCREEGRVKDVEFDTPLADRTKWLEDRLAEAVNMLVQIRDGESVYDVTVSSYEKDAGKGVDQFVAEVRTLYPRM